MYSSYFTAPFLVLSILCVTEECLGEFVRRSTSSVLRKQTSLCLMCGTQNTEFLDKHCKNTEYHIHGRCCLDSSNTTVGIDLSNCSIAQLPPFNTIMEAHWINLEGNPNLNCSEPRFSEIFEGFKHLTEILLPSKCLCPGGSFLWNQTISINNTNRCIGQKDSCVFLHETCPSHSRCVSNGPGFFECLCDAEWYGYRCMVRDGMPLVISLCCIAGATILIIVPIWLLIRRRKKFHAGYIHIDGPSAT